MRTSARDRTFTSEKSGQEYCVPGGRQVLANDGMTLFVSNGPDTGWYCSKLFIEGRMAYLHETPNSPPFVGIVVTDNFIVMDTEIKE